MQSEGPKEPLVTLRQGTQSALVIEDDPREMEFLVQLVQEVSDCRIDWMSRIGDALEWIARAQYNLIILDLSRSRMESMEALEHLRRQSPESSIIVMNEHSTVEEAVAIIKLGAEDYLQKPFNPERFKLAVRRGLDRKALFDFGGTGNHFFNLIRTCQLIAGSFEEVKIFRIVQSFLERELHSPFAAIVKRVGQSLQFLPAEHEEVSESKALREVLEIAISAVQPLTQDFEMKESHKYVSRGAITPALFLFQFPESSSGDRILCVCLSPTVPENLSEFESRLRVLRSQVDQSFKNLVRYKGYQDLAFIDDATGLYNTRYLHTILDSEISRYKKTAERFSILFIDADYFKQVNDKFGHLIGTQVLTELGRVIKRSVRETDSVFRYGGDEFVAVLPGANTQTAQTVAERIRKSIEKKRFLSREGLNVTVTISIGVATFPEDAKTKKAIIKIADQAMYQAKKTSRNKVFPARELLRDGARPQVTKQKAKEDR